MKRYVALRPGLSHAWAAGGRLYRALGRIDDHYGAASWAEGLDWLVERTAGETIAEIQYWGHGHRGCAWIDRDRLDITALSPGHALHDKLATLVPRMLDGGRALWWFRTCDTFGTQTGKDFARAWTRFFNSRAAGHTHVIHVLQSGLHTLAPDEEPTWSSDEGVIPGEHNGRTSRIGAPRTITFLGNSVPKS